MPSDPSRLLVDALADNPPRLAAAHIDRSVANVAAVQAHDEQAVGHHQRLIERITKRVARPGAIYAMLALGAGWVTLNLIVAHGGGHAVDEPPFFWLQGCVSLAALLVAMMVLTTQNRLAQRSEVRAQLDLQINLLAEQKIAKLIALVEELRRDMPTVPNRDDQMAAAMSSAVDPHAVISALDGNAKSSPATPPDRAMSEAAQQAPRLPDRPR